MKSVCREKNYIVCCGSYFLLLLFSYGLLLQNHYSKDIYVTLANGDSVNWSGWLSLGRIVPVLIKQILLFAHLAPTEPSAQSVCFFLLTWVSMCIFLAACLQNVKNRGPQEHFALAIFVCISFINPFYLEWFLFPECYFMFGTSIVLSALAVYFSSGKLTQRKWIITLIFTVLAVNSYQACLGICMVYMMTFSLVRNEFELDVKAIKELVSIIGINLIAALSNLASMHIVKVFSVAMSNRAPSITAETLIKNIQTIWSAQSGIAYNALHLLPEYIFTILLVCIGILFIYAIWKQHKSEGSHWKVQNTILIVFVIILGYGAVFAVQIFSGNLWLAPRTIVGTFFSITCVVLIIYFLLRQATCARKILLSISCVIIAFFSLQVQKISSDQLISNKIEQMEVQIILNEINNYEERTGQIVTKIAITSDKYTTWSYPGVICAYDINTRATAYGSYLKYMLEWISGRQFESVSYSEVMGDEAQEKNWDSLNVGQQIDFVDDMICVIIY